MIKQQLIGDLEHAIEMAGFKGTDIVLSIPENNQFGDYTSNIPLQIANQKTENNYQSSTDIANKIIEQLGHPGYLKRIDVAGPGFINFYLRPEILAKEIQQILEQKENFGSSDKGQKLKVQVEFISANPTGPLTLANGRGGALGDAIANILKFVGFEVEREYYVNDTGNQIRLLGESVLSRLGYMEPQDNHYKGEYVKDLAEKTKPERSVDPQKFGEDLANLLLNDEIKPSVERFGVKFDHYFSEKSLHESGAVDKVANLLQENNLAYEKDGALWFKATEFGDEKDRVLITSENERGRKEPTYYLTDIAYHLNVLERGFNKKINLWGADHHGYAQRVIGVLQALGDEDFLTILLFQLVRLFKEGKEVRMSKRAGSFVTLDELLDEVSVDAARFFFLMRSSNSHIDFDLNLAKEESSKNPVYYVQYAHARMANILTKIDVAGFSSEKLVEDSELALIRHLIQFPDLIGELSENFEVHKLTEYSIKLADLFHKFYEKCPVIMASDPETRDSRVNLVKAAKIILLNALSLLGISAPERM